MKYSATWETLDEIDQLIDPEIWFQDKAQEVTSITPEMLRGKPTFRAFFSKFADFFLGEKHLIGFNIEYDCQVLDWNLKRYNLERRFPWPPAQHDLMKASKDLVNMKGKQDQKFPKLVELHQALFGKGFEGAHSAIEDVRATGRCAIELQKQGLLWL